jgi:hypothetical protein
MAKSESPASVPYAATAAPPPAPSAPPPPQPLRAAFKCSTVVRTAGQDTVTLNASPSDNQAWTKGGATGSLVLTVTNEEAHGFFEPGKTYSVVVSPA